jgi:hypothetical protein
MTGTSRTLSQRRTSDLFEIVQVLNTSFIVKNFNGHWSDLEADVTKGNYVKVEFEKTDSPKGLRAVGVYRTEFPDAGR